MPGGYSCSGCGQYHAQLPMSYVAPAPVYWYALPEHERARRCVLDDELCDRRSHFFIKGNLEIPVHNVEHPFVWTVWVSLSQANFERAVRLWNDPRRVQEPPSLVGCPPHLPCTRKR